ncbi:hypothetical protein MMC22_010462 [Lobaria immixta]|nr:hypothetical protein [Lobaria immixta]
MPKKSYFAGGWNQAKADQLDKVQVPPKIRCSVCKKVKVAETYSKRQLGDLKHQIALGTDIKQSNIRCRLCTGAQIHEMTCAICNETKPLEGFSKAQRRAPDNARCYVCLNDHLTTKPGLKDDWMYSSEDEDSEDSDGITNNYESTYGQTASELDGITSGMARLTSRNLEHHGGSEHGKADAGVEDTEISSVVSNKEKTPSHSTANNPDVSNWNSYAKANSRRPTEYTAYDSAGVAHRQVRAPSTVASDDYASSRVPRSSKFAKVKSTEGGRGFAKPPRAATPPPLEPDTSRAATGRQVEYSDSESDDEWGVI